MLLYLSRLMRMVEEHALEKRLCLSAGKSSSVRRRWSRVQRLAKKLSEYKKLLVDTSYNIVDFETPSYGF